MGSQGIAPRAYTQIEQAQHWIQSVKGRKPLFACCFGFTDTALIPGISAAGATPAARRFTALADAEVLLHGSSTRLPTSPDGYPSPVVIAETVVAGLQLDQYLFNCGLPESLTGMISLQTETARCLSTGQALLISTATKLFIQGQQWGEKLASEAEYLVIGECVAGGTTTALAVLLALGWEATGMINSSHPVCNHNQKLALVQQGLAKIPTQASSLERVAAVGDPMQPFVAGMALAASRICPVLLAGGTQMLAVVALMQQLALDQQISWNPEQIVVGTTRWVAEDPSGNTVGLARLLGSIPLLATPLSFADSCYPQLRAYEQGHVKEGVGAGGLAITAHLAGGWDQLQLLSAIEATYTRMLGQAGSSGAMVNPS